MKDWLLFLVATGDWLTLAAVAATFLCLLGVWWLAVRLLVTLARDARQHQADAIAAAASEAYLRGRRDERLTAFYDADLSSRYPMITERAADGTIRRLDR